MTSTFFSSAAKPEPSEMTMFSLEKSAPMLSMTAWSVAASPGPPQLE